MDEHIPRKEMYIKSTKPARDTGGIDARSSTETFFNIRKVLEGVNVVLASAVNLLPYLLGNQFSTICFEYGALRGLGVE